MNAILFQKIMLILKLAFMYFFARGLYMTTFKRKKDKWIWFLMVLAFGVYGYSTYLVFRRRLVVKRKFNPKFNTHNS